MNTIHKYVTGGMAALMMSAGAFALSPSAAFAETQPPPTPAAKIDAAEREGHKLTKMLMRERKAAVAQGDRLRKAFEVQTKTERFIDTQAAAGKDVSALRTALAAYTVRINKAQIAHDKAKVTLRTHAGFSDTGEVTDREAAKQTVKSAGEDLRSAHQDLHGAGRDLRKAIKDWREANGLKAEPKQKPAKTPAKP